MQGQHNLNKYLQNDQQSYLPVQRKLSIGSVDDPLEDEADAMADKVMRMPESNFIQRKCAHCEEEQKVQRKPLSSFIQKKGTDSGIMAGEAVSSQINASRGSGQSMDSNTLSFMQTRFGADFSNINIHTGNEAAAMNRELSAKAFTVGNDIYFNEGQYQPQSGSGRHLLAHELTHTIQQSTNNYSIQRYTTIPCGPYLEEKVPNLQPAKTADAQKSWDRLIGDARITQVSKDAEKRKRAIESVNRFKSTSSGQWLITQLDSFFSGRKRCKDTGINLIFVDKVSGGSGGDANGQAMSGRTPGDLYNCESSYGYTIEIKYIEPESPNAIVPFRSTSEGVSHKYSDAESEMAHTIYHELMHIWFINVKEGDPDVIYPTGHGTKVDQGEIEPDFCRKIMAFVRDLDNLEAQIKQKAITTDAAQPVTTPTTPVTTPSKTDTEPSIVGVQGTATVGGAGGSKGGHFAASLGVDLVLGRASAFHVGPRMIFMNPNILLGGGTIGARLVQGDDSVTQRHIENPIYVDIEAGVVAELPVSSAKSLIQGVGALGTLSIGQEYGKTGVRPFWQIQGFVIINDVTNPKEGGAEGGGTIGGGVRF